MIYHVCKKAEWEAAVAAGRYAGSSQDQADGFIHFSGPDQVEASVAKHRVGQDGLVLIACDEAKMEHGLKWEVSRGGALFPHHYGDLPLDSVVRVSDLPLGADGKHMFPALRRPPTIDSFAGPASLWQRFLAFFVDGLLIGIPFMLLGYAFFPEAVALGDAGRLIGLAVITLYFGYCDSFLGAGRSLGKRLLKIEVKTRAGGFLSPAKAALRAWVLYLPFLLNGLVPGAESRPISTVLSVGIFGLLLSLLYLFLANRRTRQSLHDLIVGAQVPRAGALPEQEPIWKGHFAAVGLFLVLSASLPWLGSFATSRAPAGFSDMVAMKTAVEGIAGIRHATVSMVNTVLQAKTGASPAQPGSSIIVTVVADRIPGDPAALSRAIQEAIFPGHEDFVAEKPVLIVVNYGFDFGIAKAKKTFNTNTSLAMWKAGRPG